MEIKNIFLKVYCKTFFMLTCLILSSCVQGDTGDSNKVIIVDANGKPVNIHRMRPKFNEDQIKKQRMAVANQQNQQSGSQGREVPINKFRQQEGDNDFISSPNSIDVNQYPDDIFADRITNYDNIQTTNNNTSSNGGKSYKIEVVNDDIALAKKDNERNIAREQQKKESASLIEKKVETKGFYIQIGSYNEKKNANAIYDKYKNIHSGKIDKIGSKYRVVLGNYKTKQEAENDMNKIIKMGHYDVYITEQK